MSMSGDVQGSAAARGRPLCAPSLCVPAAVAMHRTKGQAAHSKKQAWYRGRRRGQGRRRQAGRARQAHLFDLPKGDEGRVQRRLVDRLLQAAHVQRGLGVAALAHLGHQRRLRQARGQGRAGGQGREAGGQGGRAARAAAAREGGRAGGGVGLLVAGLEMVRRGQRSRAQGAQGEREQERGAAAAAPAASDAANAICKVHRRCTGSEAPSRTCIVLSLPLCRSCCWSGLGSIRNEWEIIWELMCGLQRCPMSCRGRPLAARCSALPPLAVDERVGGRGPEQGGLLAAGPALVRYWVNKHGLGGAGSMQRNRAPAPRWACRHGAAMPLQPGLIRPCSPRPGAVLTTPHASDLQREGCRDSQGFRCALRALHCSLLHRSPAETVTW